MQTKELEKKEHGPGEQFGELNFLNATKKQRGQSTMSFTKQENALIQFIRGLRFEDLKEAHSGLKIVYEHLDYRGFDAQASELKQLATLLCNANSDYRNFTNNHQVEEESEKEAGDSVIQMINCSPGEAYHLFDVMMKYGATCGLEIQAESLRDPLIGIADEAVKVEYSESDDGDAIIVELGETCLSFELGEHKFAKSIENEQITVCVVGSDSYVAWFNSSTIPTDGIAEALNYDATGGEFVDKDLYLDFMETNEFNQGLEWLKNRLIEGAVIKETVVMGPGKQVITVGNIGGGGVSE